MTDDTVPLIPGTLEMLVLKSLRLEPMHGWGIGERIQQLSRDAFRVNQGTLYPVLERLLAEGMVLSEWRASDNNRRAKYYRITRAGEKRLGEVEQLWRRSSQAVNLVLRTQE